MTDSETRLAEEEQEISGLARDWYDSVTDEEACQLGRELLQLAEDGLKLDHRNGQVVIGDTAVQIQLLPHGIGNDQPRYSEFRYEFLMEHAEGWWLNDEDAYLELAWVALYRDGDGDD